MAKHPVFARVYERLSRLMEREYGPLRDDTLAGLSGRVIEIGCGNGLNFRHYPPEVTEVVGVEPEAHLRSLAEQEAAQAPYEASVVAATAETLPFPDSSFDAAVVTLVLCSVQDQTRALAEIRRVLRPGGELRFFEHVRAEKPSIARVQRTADHVWPFFAGGCHTSRDTIAAIQQNGFDMVAYERFRKPESPVMLLTREHVLGRARKR